MSRAVFLAVLLTFGLLTSFEASARTLVLGSVSDNIKKHFARFEPLAEYLTEQLSGDGVTDVQFTVLSSADAMAEALHDRRVDLYFDSPLVAAKVARSSNSEPFLRRWKRGIGSYHSVIMVPVDSDIHTIADLAGRRIAFQEPDSTSGFMLPAGMLRREGLTLRELPSRSAQPRDGEVGYVFTRDDKNTLVWLYKGWVDAAATDPQSYQDLARAKPGSVRVIARSIEVPRQVVIHRHGMEQTLIDGLKRVFTAMDQSERGREVLKRFNKTTRFGHFPKGVEATFNPIYDLLDELEAQGVL
ncbi:MAG: phosphate/phosphite/phosphonate ABC transporter substrate-binding protein [Alphaproteobacteria bacterium]|nr:phosphate/phosphite/phosphonate ABC transporter substrate-binding protein [Alphaproteobacteria bacterium]